MTTFQFPSRIPFGSTTEMLNVEFQDKLFLDFSNVTNITKKEAYLIIGVLWDNFGEDFHKWITMTGLGKESEKFFCEACTMHSYSNLCLDKIKSVINEPSTSCLKSKFHYAPYSQEKDPTIFFSR